MRRLLLAIVMFAGTASAVDKAILDAFKKEAAPLQGAVEDAISSVIPGPAGVIGHPKATYLEGYGVVVLVEVALEANRNPFSSPKTPSEVRAIVAQRKKIVEDKLEAFLKDRVGKLQSLGDADSLTIAVQLFNSNPADVTDLPSQLIITIKKQDATQVAVREI